MSLKSSQNQIHYVVQGDGPPLILIHGIAASLYDWQGLTPELVSAGYSTYAVDLLGHGDSAKPDHPSFYHAGSIYETLEDWISDLQLQQPPILVGHSLGGYLSLRYALEHPHSIRGLILISPFYSQSQLTGVIRAFYNKPALGVGALRMVPEGLIRVAINFDQWIEGDHSPQARKQMASDLKRASPYVLQIPQTSADLTSHLGEIHSPALVIWGTSDLTLNPASFPILVDSLVNAVGKPIRGCGHQPHISKPDLVNPFIQSFISQI